MVRVVKNVVGFPLENLGEYYQPSKMYRGIL